MTKYRNHDPRSVLLAPQYGEHVSAMTRERLHDKAEIAEELAARDLEMARMRHRIECLRGGLKSAAGWLLDADDLAGHEKCLEMAGDMEPPLMGSNVEVTGLAAASLPQGPCGLPGSTPATNEERSPEQ